MNIIKFKIKGYDEETNSVLVSFASDETENNDPDNYEPLAFQPIHMYPDITDIEVLKKKIANQGIVIAEQNKLKEEVKSNTTMINAWKNLVGQTFEYNVSDVLSSDSNVETVDNSNIIYTNEVSLQEEI